MIPENWDRTISTAITIGSIALAYWGHRRQMAKEKRTALEAAKKKYAEGELKEYAAQRDFGHIQRDLDQLKLNTAHLSKEADDRLDQLERQFERFSGALEVLTELLKKNSNGVEG
ncbi:hypothetical protein [cf. Phormidesmis sp. LEGE 11477]|uniref:hypothetical protein n=1 Tax=cf. Phormidesmis sp. LEGE 11477 TaxID=1828680 RepID=UPI00187E36BF|nr:hypothetical protein [cf. Phormidesmis sp. LEGE 11477]MBE9064150.1 hypothetical protein [cf. Phormidesmis sp. LEGE 11477]